MSRPENDRDVTEHAKGNTLQDASLHHVSSYERNIKHLPLEYAPMTNVMVVLTVRQSIGVEERPIRQYQFLQSWWTNMKHQTE